MRHEGTIARWNRERGFGFIAPMTGGADLFVHISAFAKGEREPDIGELVSYELTTAADGRQRAEHLFFPDRPVTLAPITAKHADVSRGQRRPAQARPACSNSIFGLIVSAVLLLLVAFTALEQSRTQWFALEPMDSTPVPESMPIVVMESTTEPFNCDGRSHCSQMNSCEEATAFLHHCPGMEMDGDGDGIPCEQQLCGGW